MDLLGPTFEFNRQLLLTASTLSTLHASTTRTTKLQPNRYTKTSNLSMNRSRRGSNASTSPHRQDRRKSSIGFMSTLNGMSRKGSRRNSSLLLDTPSSSSLRRGAFSHASHMTLQHIKPSSMPSASRRSLSKRQSSLSEHSERWLVSEVLLTKEEEELIESLFEEESFVDVPSKDEEDDIEEESFVN